MSDGYYLVEVHSTIPGQPTPVFVQKMHIEKAGDKKVAEEAAIIAAGYAHPGFDHRIEKCTFCPLIDMSIGMKSIW